MSATPIQYSQSFWGAYKTIRQKIYKENISERQLVLIGRIDNAITLSLDEKKEKNQFKIFIKLSKPILGIYTIKHFTFDCSGLSDERQKIIKAIENYANQSFLKEKLNNRLIGIQYHVNAKGRY